MARIEPFRGVTYSFEFQGQLSSLVTQPYDKINRGLQESYYSANALNVIRIIKSNETWADPETTYPLAARSYREWLKSGVLEEAKTPAFYLYYQIFHTFGKEITRKGFIASVALDEQNVRSHERTLDGPKADRLRLLRALEANDELIFMLYSDPVHETVKLMDSIASAQLPMLECSDDFGETHKVWAVEDPVFVEKLKKLLAPSELFIADGHHRYETACNYKRECLEKGWKPVGAQGFDHRMMCLFPMEDPGLVILPTHRVVKNVENFSGPKLVAALGQYFSVKSFSNEEALFAAMQSAGTDQVFGMRALDTKEPLYFLEPKDTTVMVERKELAGLSEASRNLGVTILHKTILEAELGIDAARLAAESHVEYVRDRREALDMVGRDGRQAAFLLNPTSLSDLKKVASLGERMPQKSTDFYPKLLAGLVMMPLHIEK
ncbi:DUF1015 domain-containing protein [bacterium]|jgi:uncharacterized protein (DUF1015 family)|nr:DUF1015 domain-containing protein [bacterium]